MQALSKARTDLQFLLVYIHSPLHRDTPKFCREVLCSQEFMDFVGNRLLMWGIGLTTQEGVRGFQCLCNFLPLEMHILRFHRTFFVHILI